MSTSPLRRHRGHDVTTGMAAALLVLPLGPAHPAHPAAPVARLAPGVPSSPPATRLDDAATAAPGAVVEALDASSAPAPTGPVAPLRGAATVVGQGPDLAVSPVDEATSRAWSLLRPAYERATYNVAAGCRLDPALLAAMAHVGSRSAEGHHVGSDLRVVPALVGPRRPGWRRVRDTDLGTLDGDPRSDRSVGALAFPVSTWTTWRVDGDGDGVRDPQDVDDAALTAAHLVCTAGGADHGRPEPDLRIGLQALWPRGRYADAVLAWSEVISRTWAQEARRALAAATRLVGATSGPTASPSPGGAGPADGGARSRRHRGAGSAPAIPRQGHTGDDLVASSDGPVTHSVETPAPTTTGSGAPPAVGPHEGHSGAGAPALHEPLHPSSHYAAGGGTTPAPPAPAPDPAPEPEPVPACATPVSTDTTDATTDGTTEQPLVETPPASPLDPSTALGADGLPCVVAVDETTPLVQPVR